MWNSENGELREFHYYNEDGSFIGKSEGLFPQQDLFDQAHYVFDNDSDMVKNLDLLAIANRKLKNLRQKLIAVPVKDIDRIMQLNEEILQLELSIEKLKKQPCGLTDNQQANTPGINLLNPR